MTIERLGRREGLEAPQLDGLVLGAAAEHLPRQRGHHALHEAPVARQSTDVLPRDLVRAIHLIECHYEETL